MSLYTAIKELASDRGKTIYRIEKDLRLSNGTISKWNKSMPRADALQDVADYLGTTPTYLLRMGKEEK